MVGLILLLVLLVSCLSLVDDESGTSGTQRLRRAVLGIAAAVLAASTGQAQVSTVASDEEVVLFPTYAYRSEPDVWRVRAHGWIFEPERHAPVRGALVERALDALDVPPADAPAFRARLRPFLVDNERRERVVLAAGETLAPMGRSGPDGHFAGELDVAGAAGADLTLRVVLPQGDARRFAGRVHALPPEGLSVVSDIDDTVRQANGDDVRARVRDALIGDYVAVPGMAAAYRALAARGAAFHWLTAAPWQLHAAYDGFLRRDGFPAGPLHMRKFRLHDRSVLDLLRGARAHKEQELAALLAAFPARRFVLIGDTVEEDAEAFAEIARRHPGQVARVLLRVVGTADDARLERAFTDCPRALWRTFHTGDELAALAEVLAPGTAPGSRRH